jgi:aerobic-type carbon monoxide dehydrogenase small subunit (CoxS/CutS family)
MADEESKQGNSKVNRRNFIKNAGVVVAGGTLGANLPVAAAAPGAQAATAAAKVEAKFRCPIDSQDFTNFAALKTHFAKAHPASAIPIATKLKVNGKEYEVQIEPQWTLQRTLQFKLGMTGAKTMCDRGACGSCTVIMDGRAIQSCTTLAVECEGKSIETIEGIAANPKWHPLIQSYAKWDAMQCGYCTPGMVVSAVALLSKVPNPTENDIRQAFAGNICCCGTYPRHPTAILEAAPIIVGV